MKRIVASSSYNNDYADYIDNRVDIIHDKLSQLISLLQQADNMIYDELYLNNNLRDILSEYVEPSLGNIIKANKKLESLVKEFNF